MKKIQFWESLEKAGCFKRQIFLVIVYFIDRDMYPTNDICGVLKIKVGTKLNMCKQVKETVMIVNYSKIEIQVV